MRRLNQIASAPSVLRLLRYRPRNAGTQGASARRRSNEALHRRARGGPRRDRDNRVLGVRERSPEGRHDPDRDLGGQDGHPGPVRPPGRSALPAADRPDQQGRRRARQADQGQVDRHEVGQADCGDQRARSSSARAPSRSSRPATSTSRSRPPRPRARRRCSASSLCASSPKAATPAIVGQYGGSMGLGSDTEGVAMAEWFRAHKPALKRVWIVKDLSLEYSKATADYFKARWKQLGGTVCGEDTFTAGDNLDLSSNVTRLRGAVSKCDVIYDGSWNPFGAQYVRAVRDAGIKTHDHHERVGQRPPGRAEQPGPEQLLRARLRLPEHLLQGQQEPGRSRRSTRSSRPSTASRSATTTRSRAMSSRTRSWRRSRRPARRTARSSRRALYDSGLKINDVRRHPGVHEEVPPAAAGGLHGRAVHGRQGQADRHRPGQEGAEHRRRQPVLGQPAGQVARREARDELREIDDRRRLQARDSWSRRRSASTSKASRPSTVSI